MSKQTEQTGVLNNLYTSKTSGDDFFVGEEICLQNNRRAQAERDRNRNRNRNRDRDRDRDK